MLYIGSDSVLKEKKGSYKLVEEIYAEGVKTLRELESCLINDVEKLIIVWQVNNLQRQYLGVLFKLHDFTRERFENIELCFHSECLLPFEYCLDAKISLNANLYKLDAKNRIFSFFKNKDPEGYSSYIDALSAEELISSFEQIGSLLYDSISKTSKAEKHQVFELWRVWNDLYKARNNNLITCNQALKLYGNQLSEVGFW